MSGVFVRDCDCRTGVKRRGGVFTCLTDDAAVKCAYAHWMRRATDDAHLYWSVHGPSGHVIGIKGAPLGDLPPPPLTYEEACRFYANE